MNRFFPSTFRTVGRTMRRDGPKLSLSKAPSKPATSASLLQHAVSKPYTPEALRKQVRSLAMHAGRGADAAQRKFLRAYFERRKLKEGELKQAAKGMYEIAEREEMPLKYAPGTITERAAKMAKQIIKENTPPPPPRIDKTQERMERLRRVQAQAHAPWRDRAATPTMQQEPTPLPTTSASGWSKTPVKAGASATGQAGSPPTLPRHSSFTSGFTGGYATSRPIEADQKTAEPEIVVPRKAPLLNPAQGVFSGGRLTQPLQDHSDQPYNAVPASGATTETDTTPASPEPPPPPPPSESGPANVGAGLPI